MTESGRWEQKKWIIQVHEKETVQKKRKRCQGGAPEAGRGKGNGRTEAGMEAIKAGAGKLRDGKEG